MNRPIFAAEHIAPDALRFISSYHQKVVSEVAQHVAADHVVVVGMGINPFVKKARQALDEAGIAFTYLEYGNYWSMWKPRLAIKMWSGWPTFPQVYADGKLIGGYRETVAALKAGTLVK